jgi:hypothetical protein
MNAGTKTILHGSRVLLLMVEPSGKIRVEADKVHSTKKRTRRICS